MTNLIRKTSIAIVALGGLIGSANVYAQVCATAPNCTDLGYKMSTSTCTSWGFKALKCPLDQTKAYCVERTKLTGGDITTYGGYKAVVYGHIETSTTDETQTYNVIIGSNVASTALYFSGGTYSGGICNCPTSYSVPSAQELTDSMMGSSYRERDALSTIYPTVMPQGCYDAGNCPVYITSETTLSPTVGSGGPVIVNGLNLVYGSKVSYSMLKDARCLCVHTGLIRPY